MLTVQSGDTVTLECVSGGPDMLPPAELGYTIAPALSAIHAANPGHALGGHILTGPVAVHGAEPGDLLQVDIERIELGADWASAASARLRARCPRISRIPSSRTSRSTAPCAAPGCHGAPSWRSRRFSA